jgi:hypothetical protein
VPSEPVRPAPRAEDVVEIGRAKQGSDRADGRIGVFGRCGLNELVSGDVVAGVVLVVAVVVGGRGDPGGHS